MIRALVFGFLLADPIDASAVDLFLNRNGFVRTVSLASFSVLLIQFQAIDGWYPRNPTRTLLDWRGTLYCSCFAFQPDPD